MMSLYRVTAVTIEGVPVVMEQCEARSDAEAMFKSLQTEGSILEAAGVTRAVVELCELCNGEWTTVSRKLVVVG